MNISNQVIDHKYFDCTTETATSAGNIIDLLYIRDNLKYYKFNLDDVQEMIDYLCLCQLHKVNHLCTITCSCTMSTNKQYYYYYQHLR